MSESEHIKDFFTNQNGKVLCIVEDMSLFRTVRHALSPFGIDLDEVVLLEQCAKTGLQTIEEMSKKGLPCIVFMERTLQGEKTTNLVLKIKRTSPNACLFIKGTNFTKEIISYLYEIGTNAIISPPISAESVFRKLSICVEKTKEQHLELYVRQLIAEANPQDALLAIEKYLLLNPESCNAYCLKGDALLADGDYPKAVEAYEYASRLNPLYTEPLKRLTAFYKHTLDDKALRLLRRLESISPFNPDRKLEMAEILLRKGEKEEASKMFDMAFKQASKEFSTLLGDMTERIAKAAGEQLPDLAEKYLAKTIEVKKSFSINDLPIFNRLGMMHRNRGEWEEALAVYKKALSIAPKDAALHYNIALAYHEGGNKADVKYYLNKAFELNRNFYKRSPGVSYNLGSIYLEYGDKTSAKKFFEHVMELEPANKKASKKLAQC
ncbi:tetratricopeptide repeat protein [Pseudodesulfovibrio sp. zrk46]|uniref:tetratricopeptide repeat protein n=1 Tax=Pseudodesulfovibrio sp. zrk46 TaxID=2725288 RepID=UPI001449BB34|nr:tetratricopeptide repeat protein [Pseudodesulfovibrio sp. zrk46]QJB57190.1 tetratricopeptide repeat protein [Pseudodesulfovibrio sp. zrk46]